MRAQYSVWISSLLLTLANSWSFSSLFERPEEQRESLGVQCWKRCHDTVGCHYYAVDVNKADDQCVMANFLDVDKCNLCIWNHVRDVPSDASILVVMGGYLDVDQESEPPALELNSLNHASTTLLSNCMLSSPLKKGEEAMVSVVDDEMVLCSKTKCVVYDKNEDEWKEGFVLKESHDNGFDIVLKDDEERDLWLLGGGQGINGITETLELYDSSTGISSIISTKLPVALADMCMVEVDENTYILIGGRTSEFEFTDKVYFLRVKENNELSFEETTNLLGPRAFLACGMVRTSSMGDEVVVAGGLDMEGNVLESVEVFNLRTLQWRLGPAMPEPRFKAMSVQDGSSFVAIGGDAGSYVLDDAVRFDYEQGWEPIDAIKGPRAGGKAIKVTKFQLKCGVEKESWLSKISL